MRSKITVLSILAVVAVWAIAKAPFADKPDATQMLKSSYSAAKNLTYAGTLRTSVNYGKKSVSAEANVLHNNLRERIDYHSGPLSGSSILDDGERVTKMNTRSMTAEISETPVAPERLDLLFKNYRPVLVGTGTMAGRACGVVQLTPKYRGNPYRKLWIDSKTLATLRTERYDSDGKLAMSTEYIHINYSPRWSPALFAIPHGWKTVRLEKKSTTTCFNVIRKNAGFTPVKPQYIPKGYSFDSYCIAQMCSTMQCATLRYTNGLNTISIFEKNGMCADMDKGAMGKGVCAKRCTEKSCMVATSQHTRIIQLHKGSLTVTLVADIAGDELQKTANSLK